MPPTSDSLNAGEDPEPELFFDQQEVLSGAGADARAAMLEHFDTLLDEPDSDQVEEVRSQAGTALHAVHRCFDCVPGSSPSCSACSWAWRPEAAPGSCQGLFVLLGVRGPQLVDV